MKKYSRRNWKLNNPGKVRAQTLTYYQRHRDKILHKRKTNPAAREYDRVRKRKKRLEDPEGVRLANRQWYQNANNKEKTKARTRRYKCQKNQERMADELLQLALLIGSKLSEKN
jgi:hypothetical protein